MSDVERRPTDQEPAAPGHRGSSADRARLWASLNRHLGADTRPQHRLGDPQRGRREEPDRRRD